MTEPTEPGELSSAALERALSRLRRQPLPLNDEEIENLRTLLRRLDLSELTLLQEMIEQWKYDKRRSADAATHRTDVRGRLPWFSFIVTLMTTIGGLIAGYFFQKPGGH